jgi:REP element-mobilizing transposase RayT
LTLYKNKYRIESIRKPGWDYSSAGLYFVTICTKWRTNDFGKIVGDNVVLNEYGIIVNEEWEQTFKIRINVIQDVYVIMPNHFHSIIGISDDCKIDGDSVPNNDVAAIGGVETPWHGVSTVGSHQMVVLKKPVGSNHPKSKTTPIGPIGQTPHTPITHWKSGVLGSIIGQFKQQVTKRIRKTGFRRFHWQLRFYDHIIRDENELNRIRNYIKFNPANWNRDTFNNNTNTLHEPDTGYEPEPWMI